MLRIDGMLLPRSSRFFSQVLSCALVLAVTCSAFTPVPAKADGETRRIVIGEQFGPEGEIDGQKLPLRPEAAGLELFAPTPIVLGVEGLRVPAPADQQLNLVFVSEGYQESELPQYRAKVNALVTELFSLDLYSQYSPFFNVYRVDVPSAESGISDDLKHIAKNTALSVRTGCYDGFPDVFCVRDDSSYAAASAAPGVDVIIIVANTKSGRSVSMPTSFGTLPPYSRFAGTMIMPGASPRPEHDHLIIAHELGHLIGKLQDEYTELSGTAPVLEVPFANISIFPADRMLSLGSKWARWLGYVDPVAGIGPVSTFEGARFSPKGVYRPTETSLMRELLSSFNAPSKEAMVSEIDAHISPFISVVPGNIMVNDLTALSVDYRHPQGLDFHLTWKIDGVAVQSDNGFFIAAGVCPSVGVHTVEAVVTDDTKLVRDETLRANSMTWKRSWSLVSRGCDTAVFNAFLNTMKTQLTAELRIASAATPRPQVGRPLSAKNAAKAAAILASRQRVQNILYNLTLYASYIAPNDPAQPKLFKAPFSTNLYSSVAQLNLNDSKTADRIFKALATQVRAWSTVPRAPR